MSKKKIHDQINDVFEIGLYFICGLAAIYYFVQMAYPKTFQAILIILVLLIVRGLVKWTKSEFPPALRASVLFFITLAMLLANLFGLYGVIPYLDKAEHVLSGVILCFVGLLVLKKMIRTQRMGDFPAPIAIWFALFFAVAMAGCWEIYEFTIDQLFGLTSQNGSLTDTMTDIICGTAGAIVTALYMASKAKSHPLSILSTGEAD